MSDGALSTHKLNLEYAGDQRVLRDSKMTPGCLGPHPAVLKVDGEIFDRKLQVGDVQSSCFVESDPPPFMPLSKLDQKLIV